MAWMAFQLGSANKKVLWTNSGSEFGSQTITVSGLSNYKNVFLRFSGSQNDDTVRLNQGETATLAWSTDAGTESAVRVARPSGDSIWFGRSYYSNHAGNEGWSGYNDKNCIPLEIYALT